MRETGWHFALHVCVLGAAARLHLVVTRRLDVHARFGDTLPLGTLLGGASILALAMTGGWRDTSESMAPWEGLFLALAGLLRGFKASLSCAVAMTIGVLLVSSFAPPVPLTVWSSQLVVAIFLGALGRGLSTRVSTWPRYALIFLLGCGLSVIPMLLWGSKSIAVLEGRVWAPQAAGCALALCLGYRAFIGLSEEPNHSGNGPMSYRHTPYAPARAMRCLRLQPSRARLAVSGAPADD
jgi:hypothetical protein